RGPRAARPLMRRRHGAPVLAFALLLEAPVAALAQAPPSPLPSPGTATPSPQPATPSPQPATPSPQPATPSPQLGNPALLYPGYRPAEPRLTAPLGELPALRYALAHAPEILAAKANAAQLVSSFAKARAGQYPTITGSLQNQMQKQSNESGSLAEFGLSPATNFSQNTAQISSTYNLYNGTQQLTAQQAKKQVENATDEVHRQEEQTTLDVVSRFFDLAARRQAVVVAENDVRYEQALLAVARENEQVGRVAGVDVLRAQVAVGRSSSTAIQARVDEENAREALAVRIGAPATTAFDVPADLPEPALPAQPPEMLAALAARSRPEIAAAKAALDAAKLQDASVDSDLRPVVQLSGSFGSQVSPTEFVLEQQQLDATNAQTLALYNLERALFPTLPIAPPATGGTVNRNVPGFWQIGVTSTFQLPLLDYGQRAAAHHAARAQIASAQAALDNAYDTVIADVRAAVRDAASAKEKLALAKESAALAGETARIAQLQYKHGLISFTDVAQTEQTALSAEQDLVAARVAYVVAAIRLRVVLGPPDLAAAADLRGL
ncbi:MAG: TolC family protein, partial [Candidatus Baltobacteraceae bacterium]